MALPITRTVTPVRRRIVLLAAALLVAAAVWATAMVQREATTESGERLEAVHHLLMSMVDQETGLRGFQLTGNGTFLDPLHAGERRFAAAVDEVDEWAAGEVDESLDDAVLAATVWRQHADREIALVREVDGPRRPELTTALNRKATMDRFRAEIAEIEEEIVEQRDEAQRVAAGVSVAVSLALFLLVGGAGLIWWRRTDRATHEVAERERRYRESQAEFAQTMQLVSSQDEANALLKRHLERSRPGRQVTVLNRNNSANRLEPRTPVDESFAARLVDAEPRSCVAIRLARPHEERAGDDALLACELCGKAGDARLCSPLLVSGEVIGSVLATQPAPFDDQGRQRMEDSVTTAAPVLANLRAVAIAEARAATDALTGLPNRRAVNDTLKRMIAQASRGMVPLAAIAIDLDRFKDVNDRYGHDAGDEVLAAAAAALADGVRASDFAGRMGGEEFIVLAPETGADGGAILAEHLRQAIERIRVPGVECPITASFGVAAFPEVAATPELLLRKADRALYRAKESGRNRVEVALAPSELDPERGPLDVTRA